MSRSRRYFNHPLEQAIYAKGYRTMEDFCRAADINYSTLYYFLCGRTKMFSGYVIQRISMALKITPNDVVRLCEAKRNEFYY